MRAVSRYAPPVAVMALIFALSATPDLSTGLGLWDLVLRKLGHMSIFAVLWVTLARAADWRRPLAATVVAILYATSDEIHQTFVDGRHGTPVDVAIDTVGIGLAALAWLVAARRRGRPGPPWPLRFSGPSGGRQPARPVGSDDPTRTQGVRDGAAIAGHRRQSRWPEDAGGR